MDIIDRILYNDQGISGFYYQYGDRVGMIGNWYRAKALIHEDILIECMNIPNAWIDND